MNRARHALKLCIVLTLSLFSETVFAKSMSPVLPEELVLSGDNIIDAVVAGRKLRLEVRPNAPQAPTLNPAIAQEMKLKPGMFGFITSVGPERVTGVSAVLRVNYGKAQKQRVFWASRIVSRVADGVISPASLPYKRVRFSLGNARSQERLTTLPLDNFGFLGRMGMGTELKIGKEKMQVSFALNRETALVSAPTGNWLAREMGGTLSGKARGTMVYYDIERPVRAMMLKQSLPIGPFSVSEMDVRVSDYGDATGIAEARAATDSSDNEEIVVTGKSDKDVDLRLTLGRGFLKSCSSLTFDLEHRNLLLSCVP
jgi:hypothetical protein